MNAELIKQLREEAERLSAHSLDRGVQEAGIAANLAERAADTIEEMLKALIEAAEFIQPFNRACAEIEKAVIGASTQTWEYLSVSGRWNSCRSMADAMMWAEDGREIRISKAQR